MAKRKTDLGLGRGLNALLGDPELPAQGEGSISLPISQVEPGLNQPRKRFDPETLSDLAESIRVHGWPPATIRSSPASGVGAPPSRPALLKCPPSLSKQTTERSWNWDSLKTSSGKT